MAVKRDNRGRIIDFSQIGMIGERYNAVYLILLPEKKTFLLCLRIVVRNHQKCTIMMMHQAFRKCVR